jgi:hypothetical protein
MAMASVLNRRSFLIAAVPALVLLSGLGADKVQADSIDVGDIFIGELEKRLIASYYHHQLVAYQQSPAYQKGKGKKKHKHKGLPPGLAKKGKVPPGIAKQLTRNNQVPPGLEYQPLPHDLIVQLPPLQPGYRYRIVDDRVLLIKAASNVILDVLTVAALDLLN